MSGYYLDNVTRLDGERGFVVAQHPEYSGIFCVKWEDEGDPRWASPDLIASHEVGSGVDHWQRLVRDMETQVIRERFITGY